MSSKTKTTATKEEARPALVLKLRFPEFRETKWDKKKIGSMLIETPRPIDLEDETEYNLVTVKRRYGGLVSRGNLKGREIKVNTQFLVHEGDFLISKRQIVHDACGLVPETLDGAVVSNEYSVLTPKAGCSVEFINWFAQQPCVSRSFLQCSVGIVIEKMLFKLDAWLKREFLFPGLPEQQKIAECLSSVDELMAAQARKVDALKTHKKGLMQQLFPREGETQPRLRFPEFQNAGEWVTEALGQLASYENGKAYEQNITENGKFVVVNSRFISTDGAVRKYTNADHLIAKTGEVLMVLSDLPKGKALAKCYFVEADDRYAVNQRVCRLKPTRIDGKFLYYILNRHPRLLAYDDGLNQTHLSKGGVTECPLCVPAEKAEQQRIASCLSSLDALITAETQTLESLKTHKKGLMQKLFPSMEEIEA